MDVLVRVSAVSYCMYSCFIAVVLLQSSRLLKVLNWLRAGKKVRTYPRTHAICSSQINFQRSSSRQRRLG